MRRYIRIFYSLLNFHSFFLLYEYKSSGFHQILYATKINGFLFNLKRQQNTILIIR